MKYAVSEGIIDLDDVRNKMKEQEKQRLLSKHKYKVFQDNDGRWKTTFPDNTKKSGRRLVACKTRDDLNKKIITFYATQEDKEYTQENVTLTDLFPMWLNYKNSHTNSPSYIRRIKNDWNRYYKDTTIVNIPITNLTRLQLDQWAYNLIKQYKLTKKQYYNLSIIMRQCLDYACEDEIGIISNNVFNGVKVDSKIFKKQQKPKSETQVFLKDEEKLICKAAFDKFNKRPQFTTPLAIILNFQLGLRVGELFALKWSDIEGEYICIQRMEIANYEVDDDGNVTRNGTKVEDHTKSSAGERKIYLNQEAKDILQLVKKTNMKYGYYDDNYIFVGRNSKRITTSSVNKYLFSLCNDINISNKSSHKIRKTYISTLFDLGLNVNKIREIAGHEDEKTSLNNYCFDRNRDTDTERLLEKTSVFGKKVASFGDD